MKKADERFPILARYLPRQSTEPPIPFTPPLTAAAGSFMIRVRLIVIKKAEQRGHSVMPRTTTTITFSLPLEMAERVRRVMKDEGRTLSDLIREALRSYMDESEWLREARRERVLARHAQQQKAEGGDADE